ncbi:hypothetical protein WME79_09970 [Sorangium sp. So ce726]|uniref:hypothetical protein n=1 Tax=Sorangium sp. So ce726 TaxID=3133319 RepID=UPI003F6103CB
MANNPLQWTMASPRATVAAERGITAMMRGQPLGLPRCVNTRIRGRGHRIMHSGPICVVDLISVAAALVHESRTVPEVAVGATLGMGNNLHFVRPDDGSHWPEISGEPFDVTNITHSSVEEVKALAKQTLGIEPSCWPFYTEIELEWEVPLDDAHRKCDHLREVFSQCPQDELPDDHWLRFFATILRRGWDFYTHV